MQLRNRAVVVALLLLGTFARAQSSLPDTAAPGQIPVFPPDATYRPAERRPAADSVPDVLYYRFESGGTTTPNLATAPPSGTATATVLGAITQNGEDLNASNSGFSLVGSGLGSTTDYLDTGWAPDLGTASWTISFQSRGITTTSTALFYVFGDLNTASLRAFTGGVAGSGNFILRGAGLADVIAPGAAIATRTRTTFVYDSAENVVRAYVDGTLVNTIAQPAPNLAGTGPFKVMGYATSNSATAGGLLDDFRVYRRALTAQEVADLDSGSGSLAIAPATLAFGNQPVGTTSAVRSATLSNTSTVPIRVTAVAPAPAPFAAAGGTCADRPFVLAGGASCTLGFTYAPLALGAASGAALATVNGASTSTIALTGNGTPSADLSIGKTADLALVDTGIVQYTLLATNQGPQPAQGATIVDQFDSTLFAAVAWNCFGVSGGACTGSGTGDINRQVDLPVGGSVVFVANATLRTLPAVAFANTATITAPPGLTELNPANNSSTVASVIGIFANGFEPAPPTGR